jgi:hypothetical protein
MTFPGDRTGQTVAIRKACVAISDLKDDYHVLNPSVKPGANLKKLRQLCIYGDGVILRVGDVVKVDLDKDLGLIRVIIPQMHNPKAPVYFILRECLEGEVDWKP